MSKTIYIADDERITREILISSLSDSGFSVQAFDSGDELYNHFLSCPCDMIILDVLMSGTDGFVVCSWLRDKSSVPIIILSSKNDEIDRITGLRLGCDDYIIKPFSPLELVARVNALFRRIDLDRRELKNGALTFGCVTLNASVRECLVGKRTVDLTPTEFSLLSYLFANKDRAISRTELLKNVWKFNHDIDTRATDDVLKRLRKKLVGSDIIIQSIRGYGFKLALSQPAQDPELPEPREYGKPNLKALPSDFQSSAR